MLYKVEEILDAYDIVYIFDKGEETWGGTMVTCIAASTALYGISRYVRLAYPCLTPFEMKQVWNDIEDVYSKALGAGPLAPAEWVDIENIRRNLEMEASRIRVEALEGYRWKTYCGFNPLLMPRIARWYKMSKELEDKMIIVSERDKQSRLEPDGQIATGSSLQAQVSPHLDTEKPVGSQYEFPPSPPSAA